MAKAKKGIKETMMDAADMMPKGKMPKQMPMKMSKRKKAATPTS